MYRFTRREYYRFPAGFLPEDTVENLIHFGDYGFWLMASADTAQDAEERLERFRHALQHAVTDGAIYREESPPRNA